MIDFYGAAVAAATGSTSIPQADWSRIRVYVPQALRGDGAKAAPRSHAFVALDASISLPGTLSPAG